MSQHTFHLDGPVNSTERRHFSPCHGITEQIEIIIKKNQSRSICSFLFKPFFPYVSSKLTRINFNFNLHKLLKDQNILVCLIRNNTVTHFITKAANLIFFYWNFSFLSVHCDVNGLCNLNRKRKEAAEQQFSDVWKHHEGKVNKFRFH